MGAYDPLSAGFTDKRFGGKGAFDPLSAGFTDKRSFVHGDFDPLSTGFVDGDKRAGFMNGVFHPLVAKRVPEKKDRR